MSINGVFAAEIKVLDDSYKPQWLLAVGVSHAIST
jgi:hypothetical protein